MAALDAICQRAGADISFGIAHFAIRWNPHLPEHRDSTAADALMLREYVWTHPAEDISAMAGRLASALHTVSGADLSQFDGDVLLAACAVYNNGNDWRAIPAARLQRYREKLAIARQIVGVGGGGALWLPAEPTVETVRGIAAGAFTAMPQGVILHGSRSGNAGNSTGREFDGTVNYVRNGTNGETGWHVTVGDGRVALHLTPSEFGWHARAASRSYIGVEFAQAVEAHEISDAQVSAFAWYFQHVIRATWPGISLHMPTHAEVERSGETGRIDGKSDVFGYGSPRADELRARIRAAIGE